MSRLEVRITVGTTRGQAAVDERAIAELLESLRGHRLTLRGAGGDRLEVIECRLDPRPSSSAAFFAVVEVPEEP